MRVFSGDSIRAKLLRAFLPAVIAVIVLEELLETKLSFFFPHAVFISSLRIILFIVIEGVVLLKITKSLGDQINMLILDRDKAQREMAQRLGKRKVLLERIIKRKVKMLQKAQKDLEDSKRLSDIGTLSAIVAHELRNPLAVIKTAVYNLKNKAKDPLSESNFANIDKKISESETIIRNLLSYAKISIPRLEKLGCTDVLRECLEAVNHKYDDWNVAVKINCNCAENDFITADKFQLTELYVNILDNAYQALLDKRRNIEINERFDKVKNTFIITFKDNGIGMKEDVLEKACEPFFTTKSRGIGLGLTVCKQIVNLHAGQLHIASDGKSGTAVTITLPVRS